MFPSYTSDDSRIAFSASNVTRVSFVGARAVFSDVLFNEGQGYNNTNGYFMAPSDGLYSFNVHLCVVSDGGVYAELVTTAPSNDSVGGERHATVFGSTVFQETGYSSCTSFQGLTPLAKGDSVYVKMPDTIEHLIQVSDYYRCQFTGMRV